MKDIIIVCAGGTGVEVHDLIENINYRSYQETGEIKYNILGFLSDVPDLLDGALFKERIIGTIKDWQPTGDAVYAMGNSTPKSKEYLAQLLKSRGAKFETLVSPDALVSSSCVMGEGCVIMPGSMVGQAVMGDFVSIQASMIGRSVIGDYCTTTGYANTTNAKLGKRVFVGSHVVILNDRKIGDDAYLCAGSIVVSHVKANTKVMGNPAKRIDF